MKVLLILQSKEFKKPDKVGENQIDAAVAKKTSIKSWGDLIAIQNEITRIMNRYKKKK